MRPAASHAGTKLGSKLSDETKAKILASNPNRKEVEVLDLETNETTIKKVNKKKAKGPLKLPTNLFCFYLQISITISK